MEIERLARHPAVARAREAVRDSDAETLADQLALVQIPAPTFDESARARWVEARLGKLGAEDVALDEVGNVLARLPAAAESSLECAAPLLLSAHLDTVFPDGTELAVRQNGGRILAPGIADNARGLAALLAVARSLRLTGLITRHPLVLAATVGEEGTGDLCGVKHLFDPLSPWRGAQAFITLDGTGRRRIVHRALGSRRLRATVSGPGGHSWADWGVANPIHALGLAVAALVQHAGPHEPRSALTVSRIGGGTSVNSIPVEAWLEVDLRSERSDTLLELEARVRQALGSALEQVNGARRRGTTALRLDIALIGSRPSGETPSTSPLVRAARAATRFLGATPELVSSSTDANIPISLGIPAIALGAGGESGGTHTPHEWYSNEGGPEGIERVLLTVLAMTGVAG